MNVGDVLRRLMRPIPPGGRAAGGSSSAAPIKLAAAATKGTGSRRAVDVTGAGDETIESLRPSRADVMALSSPAAEALLPGWDGAGDEPVALSIWEDGAPPGKDAFQRAYRIELAMRPPQLGRVKVILWAHGGDLHVQFECEEAEAAEAMAPRMAELVQSLEEMFHVRTAGVTHRCEAKPGEPASPSPGDGAPWINVSV